MDKMNKKRNIILITIDSLRADHLGYMDYEKNVSPNIDALAKESTIFTNAYSMGPTTVYSFPSILTSTYPLDYHGPYKIKRPRKLISEVLKKEGFTTAAFHSSPFLSDYFGYNKGWDFFEDIKVPTTSTLLKKRKRITIFKKTFKKIFIRFFPLFFIFLSYLKYRIKWPANNRIKGSFLTQTVKDFIFSQEKKPPFFAWVHYMDIHSPYFARGCFQNKPLSFSEYIASYSAPLLGYYSSRRLKKITEKYINQTQDLYDEGIKYVDRQIKDLIDFLKANDIYNNCIIIFAGDHGEEFLEHGSGSHFSKLYNEVLHIPLLIKIPGYLSKVVKNPVSLIDLSPTICDILNIERDVSFKGENLFNRPNFPIFHQIGVWKKDISFFLNMDSIENSEIECVNQYKIACQFKNWKYILDYSTKNEEFYNFLTDPKEQNNLALMEPEMIFQMRNIVQEFKEKNPPIKWKNH